MRPIMCDTWPSCAYAVTLVRLLFQAGLRGGGSAPGAGAQEGRPFVSAGGAMEQRTHSYRAAAGASRSDACTHTCKHSKKSGPRMRLWPPTIRVLGSLRIIGRALKRRTEVARWQGGGCKSCYHFLRTHATIISRAWLLLSESARPCCGSY